MRSKKYNETKAEYNTALFRSVGLYNDINGKENHLVKVPGVLDYAPPKKSDPRQVMNEIASDDSDDSDIDSEEADSAKLEKDTEMFTDEML